MKDCIFEKHKISFETTGPHKYRPKDILVDGEHFSLDKTEELYGYCWVPTAKGNKLCYTSDDGKRGINIPQDELFK